jgi:exopolysaccharide biosynthesis protein
MELISGGVPLFLAHLGTMIGFTEDGQCEIESSPVADALRNLDPAYPDDWKDSTGENVVFWQQVSEGLACGPRLLRDGAVCLNPAPEGLRSAEVLASYTRRSAIGITGDHRLLLVTVTSSLPDLACVMQSLGCAQAMNLDGGASSGIWVRGRFLQRPGRQISNALLILPK